MAAAPIKIGICHFTSAHSAWWPKNEIREFVAMINNDVPAAIACGVPKKRTRTGIARKPPPIPKRPVIEPIASEVRIRMGTGILLWSSSFGVRNIDRPAKKRTAEKPVVINASGI